MLCRQLQSQNKSSTISHLSQTKIMTTVLTTSRSRQYRLIPHRTNQRHSPRRKQRASSSSKLCQKSSSRQMTGHSQVQKNYKNQHHNQRPSTQPSSIPIHIHSAQTQLFPQPPTKPLNPHPPPLQPHPRPQSTKNDQHPPSTQTGKLS